MTRESVSLAIAASSAGKRRGLARFVNGERSRKPLLRIGRHQGQAADRGIDHAPQPIVDADVGLRSAGAGSTAVAGRGIEHAAAVADKTFLLSGSKNKRAGLQRLDDGKGARRAGCRHSR